MKLIIKFGGTSVGSAERIENVGQIIKENSKENQLVVVTSALGETTDYLVEIMEKAPKGDNCEKIIEKLEEDHSEIIENLIKNDQIKNGIKEDTQKMFEVLKKLVDGIITLKQTTPKSNDQILSYGERLAAPILAAKLQEIGLNSIALTGGDAGIITDDKFGEASPLIKLTKHRLQKNLEAKIDDGLIPVITGFIGKTQEEEITTIGRGGSDYTATLLGACLNFDEIWIMTDVDGLLSTDPRILDYAKVIPNLSYEEASEMAVMGAKSMHPRALEPAKESNTPVRIKNSFNKESNGTLINDSVIINEKEIAKAVTRINGIAMINVTGMNMTGNPGIAGQIFSILGRNEINIIMISQSISESNITFLINKSALTKALSVLEIGLLNKEIVKEIKFEDEVSVIAIVGAGMKGTHGVASRLFNAISKKEINVKMIAQGSSQLNLSFVVNESDSVEAIKSLHDEFIKK